MWYFTIFSEKIPYWYRSSTSTQYQNLYKMSDTIFEFFFLFTGFSNTVPNQRKWSCKKKKTVFWQKKKSGHLSDCLLSTDYVRLIIYDYLQTTCFLWCYYLVTTRFHTYDKKQYPNNLFSVFTILHYGMYNF